jgi:hypothetical protein
VARRRPGRNATSPWPFVGMAGMACAFFLYAASGLVAPWWGVVALLAIWVLLLVVACAWWTPHPTRVPFVAVFALVLWFCAVTAGGAWLGWTA